MIIIVVQLGFINDGGKNSQRGRDLIWSTKIEFTNAKEFEESQIF